MPDCSPAPLGGNRVINTTANLSSSGRPGFQLQPLLSCYFQTGVKEKGSLLPSSPQRSSFPGQEKAATELPGAWGAEQLSVVHFSVSSAILEHNA